MMRRGYERSPLSAFSTRCVVHSCMDARPNHALWSVVVPHRRLSAHAPCRQVGDQIVEVNSENVLHAPCDHVVAAMHASTVLRLLVAANPAGLARHVAALAWLERKISLRRTAAPLGILLVGRESLAEPSHGIFVAGIEAASVAAVDGRLQVCVYVYVCVCVCSSLCSVCVFFFFSSSSLRPSPRPRPYVSRPLSANRVSTLTGRRSDSGRERHRYEVHGAR